MDRSGQWDGDRRSKTRRVGNPLDALPVTYLFDYNIADRTGILQVKCALPYSDLTSLPAEERQRYIETGAPLEFSHTLEDQIGGQLDAGFLLTGFFEDAYGEEENDLLTNYMPTFIATRATKPYHKTREEDLA